MGKMSSDAVLDAALAKVATCTRLVVCSTAPANFAGIAAVALADVVLTAGTTGGDYAIANSTINGRKLTVSQQATIPVDAAGTARAITLDDGAALHYTTTCTAQVLSTGNTVTVPAWKIRIADPT